MTPGKESLYATLIRGVVPDVCSLFVRKSKNFRFAFRGNLLDFALKL